MEKKDMTAKIAAWKKKHGDVFAYEVDGKTCYLHRPGRDVIAAASVVGKEDPFKFAEIILSNCWLGGDEELRDDDRYFIFDSHSPHRIEVGASWVVSEKLPFTLSWYTILFGAADRNDKGERAYASYFEVAYPFTVKTVDMKAGVGMVPWNAATTYNCGDRDFYVQNVFLNAGKTWDIKGADGMKIGIFTNLIWNPALDDVNFVGGFSFRM